MISANEARERTTAPLKEALELVESAIKEATEKGQYNTSVTFCYVYKNNLHNITRILKEKNFQVFKYHAYENKIFISWKPKISLKERLILFFNSWKF